jgi:tetrahydromethanopterin S-methyltransferase subunit B
MADRPETKAQLGCGTLIVIAIIVLIFSGGRDSSKLRREVRELNEKIDRLERKIDDLSAKLEPSTTTATTTR